MNSGDNFAAIDLQHYEQTLKVKADLYLEVRALASNTTVEAERLAVREFLDQAYRHGKPDFLPFRKKPTVERYLCFMANNIHYRNPVAARKKPVSLCRYIRELRQCIYRFLHK